MFLATEVTSNISNFYGLILQSAEHKASEVPKQVMQSLNASLRLVPWRSGTEVVRGEGLGVQPGSPSSSSGLGGRRDTTRSAWQRPVSHLLHKWGTNPSPDNSREGGGFSHPSH